MINGESAAQIKLFGKEVCPVRGSRAMRGGNLHTNKHRVLSRT